MLAAKMMMAAGAAQQKIYADDVFSTYLYTGTGTAQAMPNGLDLSGDGGLVWIKCRNTAATNHALVDSLRGDKVVLQTNTTGAAAGPFGDGPVLNSSGFEISGGGAFDWNFAGYTYTSWSFRTADKFFRPTIISHTNGTPTNISFPSLETLGMVAAKITNTTGDWLVWHRSLTAGNNLKLNLTVAQSATNAWLSVSGTTATLSASAPTGSYVVYGWAHDSGTDGVIQCGSFTTDGSGNAAVNLGWEPQWVILKPISITGSWVIIDSMRGMVSDNTDNQIYPNTAGAEVSAATVDPSATGFNTTTLALSQTYAYVAIRRPNKPPTTGTQVFNQTAASGVFNAGFPVDMRIGFARAGAATNAISHSRLVVGNRAVVTSSAAAQTSTSDVGFDSSTGLRLSFGINEINYLFKRAPSFLDVVCDTGTGSAHAVTHNLTVAPELLIRKSRSGATQWEVWHSALAASEKLVLNSTAAKTTDATAWNSTDPTATTFTVGTGANVNTNSATYVTYLFATLAGISKVGSYTGNGASQTINCGFTTGARFVLIKQVGGTGDWYVWDTARGIIAGNDPHLSLNTTAAEVTTDDSIDPDSSGFIVNQLAATNINVNAASYIYLAIA